MRRHGDAAAGLGQHLADPRDRGGDDRPPGGQIFRELHRAADRELGAAGRETDTGGGHVRRHERAIVDEAREADALGDPPRTNELLDGLPLVAISDEDEQRARAPCEQLREGLDHGREVVPPREQADEQHVLVVRIEPELAHGGGAVARCEELGVGAVRHDLDTLGRGAEDIDERIPQALRHGQQPVRRAPGCADGRALDTLARAEHEPEPRVRIEVDRREGVDFQHDAIAQRSPGDDRRQEPPVVAGIEGARVPPARDGARASQRR